MLVSDLQKFKKLVHNSVRNMKLLPKWHLALAILPLLSGILASPALAQTRVNVSDLLAQSSEATTTPVNSVSDLKDVSPRDWAYSALRNLTERYKCIETYPNMTFRGNSSMSRYEFAATLSKCLSTLESLSPGDSPLNSDQLDQIKRMVSEFQAELSSLGATVDDLDSQLAAVEEQQFSTTTKLTGEVAFTLADTFGDTDNTNAVFTDKVRLQLVSSFTGKDQLYTRLTTGNIGNSFAAQIGSNEGRYAYDTPGDNNITIDRLHYNFPIGDKLKVYTMARLGGHHFYADTFNPGLEAGGGANGALSRFGERNPIYRLGLGGGTTGVGFKYDLGEIGELSLGYLAPTGSNPADRNALFNGAYSAMGQVVIKPTDDFKFGLTYINGYNPSINIGGGQFGLGGTGTPIANLRPGNLVSSAFGSNGVTSNAFGIQALYDISENVSLRGWFGYTDIDSAKSTNSASAEVLNYAGILAFNNLGKKGNMGYLLVGAEPYVSSAKTVTGTDIDLATANLDSTPLHVELAYKMKVQKGITITPGLIWLGNIGQSDATDDVLIGTVRTTFSF